MLFRSLLNVDGYSLEDVHYQWVADSPIGIEEGVHLAQYDLVDIVTKAETRPSIRNGIISYEWTICSKMFNKCLNLFTDDYSVIIVQFVLARHKGLSIQT